MTFSTREIEALRSTKVPAPPVFEEKRSFVSRVKRQAAAMLLTLAITALVLFIERLESSEIVAAALWVGPLMLLQRSIGQALFASAIVVAAYLHVSPGDVPRSSLEIRDFILVGIVLFVGAFSIFSRHIRDRLRYVRERDVYRAGYINTSIAIRNSIDLFVWMDPVNAWINCNPSVIKACGIRQIDSIQQLAGLRELSGGEHEVMVSLMNSVSAQSWVALVESINAEREIRLNAGVESKVGDGIALTKEIALMGDDGELSDYLARVTLLPGGDTVVEGIAITDDARTLHKI